MKVDGFMSSATSLRAADLKGKHVPMTMAGCGEREFDDGNKLELQFDGSERSLILNKTNLAVIVDAYGAETDDWKGKKVILFPTKTSFGNETVDCIRVMLPSNDTDGGSPF